MILPLHVFPGQWKMNGPGGFMANMKICSNCRAFIDPKHKVCEYCGAEVAARKWAPAPSSAISSLIPQDNFTTIILLLVNFGLFVATLVMTMKSGSDGGLFAGIDMTVLRLFGAKDAFFIAHGEWWRLVTAGFLHAGVFHLLMNSWVLFDLGMMAEQTFGTSRFLVIYFVSSVFGFIASMYWSPYAISVGASAAVCGLIGAMIAHSYRSGGGFGSFYVRWAVLIIVIGLMPGFHIDNAAHIGGMAAGFVIGYFAGTPQPASAGEPLWTVAAGVSLAVVAASFYLAYQSLIATPYL